MTSMHAVAILLATCAALCDIRTRRVPNRLTFGMAALALATHAWVGGAGGALSSAAGLLVGLCCFLPIFLLGGMGAGDVKLLAAIGAWIGPGDAFVVALTSSIAGGALAIVVALWHGYLRRALGNLWLLAIHWQVNGLRPMPALTLVQGGGPRLAYAVPIAVGVMVTSWIA